MEHQTRRLTSATNLENLRKEAKRWLKALRTGDAGASARLRRTLPDATGAATLRDVQLALAREHGFPGWTSLKEHLAGRAPSGHYTDLIKPDEFGSEAAVGPWASRGCDVWEAIGAARAGDSATLRQLLQRDPNLARYAQPLHFAVREGHVEATRMLLNSGADSDLVTASGEDLILVAGDRGHSDIVRLLEEVRSRSNRTRALDVLVEDPAIHARADVDDVDEVRRMLDREPELVHRGDRKGGTPLHRAVLASAHKTIDLLLDRGADINARHGSGRGDGSGYAPVDYQPIDLALFWQGRRDLETGRLLLRRGAAYDLSVAAAFGDLTHITKTLDAEPARIREARPCGKRPLPAAVEFGHDAIVRLLLDRGADPTWPEGEDAPRGSALHSAARLGNRPIVELLLDRGADPSAHVDAAGNATSAAKTSDLRALLLSRGGRLDCYDLVWLGEDDEVVRRVKADPSAADAGCGGVFTAAATLGKRDLVVRLIEAGARVPTVLTACRSYLLENVEILRLLLASGMNPDLPNWQRATPLHDLCGRDARGRPLALRLECATVLLDAGANISAKDEEYRSTPLAWAARSDLPDMVEFLLSRGAPTNLPDDEPWATPLAWAIKRGHSRIAKILKEAGAQ